MAWIKTHSEIWEHHKTLKLCDLLKKPDYQVVGHLVSLWHFALNNAWRDANLEPWGEYGIERAARWDGATGVFIKAIRDAGFLDGFIIHDWIDQAGKLVDDRLYAENRRRVEKSRRLLAARGRGRGRGRVEVDKMISPLPPKDGFRQVWATYPSKVGMKAAERHYKASVKTAQDHADIQAAIQAYLRSDRVRNGYVQNGSTWFNNWRDWMGYREPSSSRHLPPRNYPAPKEKEPTEEERQAILKLLAEAKTKLIPKSNADGEPTK